MLKKIYDTMVSLGKAAWFILAIGLCIFYGGSAVAWVVMNLPVKTIAAAILGTGVVLCMLAAAHSSLKEAADRRYEELTPNANPQPHLWGYWGKVRPSAYSGEGTPPKPNAPQPPKSRVLDL